MYLSRLVINQKNRVSRRDLSDVHMMHRTVMSAFPCLKQEGSARAKFAVLYRLDVDQETGRAVLLVQSRELPDWTHLPTGYLLPVQDETVDNPATKDVTKALAALYEGQILRFRLRANPTKKIDTKSGLDGRRRNGRRVDLRTESQQVEWLARRADMAGFRLVPAYPNNKVPAVQIGTSEKLIGRASQLTVAGVLFDGLLEITDADKFRSAIKDGIGPGKAFGCGLMSIAPPTRHE